MRIAYFLRDISDCGGIQQMTVTMLNAFVSKGYECSVISLFHKYNFPFFPLSSKVRQISLFENMHSMGMAILAAYTVLGNLFP